VKCHECNLDHEWAPEWTLSGCRTHAKFTGHDIPTRVRLIMAALKNSASRESFELLLFDHLRAVRSAKPEADA
jgi:hypothetical protein